MYPQNENNESIVTITKLRTHNFQIQTDDKIEPALNPFTLEGLIMCLILDYSRISHEIEEIREQRDIEEQIKALQKAVANFRADIPGMLRDELKRFRGDI